MKNLGLNEIREKYLAFFESKGHIRLKSFPLVPQNDKSLLLINSGMAPMKPYFTGLETPPGKRVTTCQKCIRTDDIENVGVTSRHGSFFEMLGNFSFGDYFKKEVIPWAWEFLTEVMEIPGDRLYASVYVEDDEAFDIWHNIVGLPKERIVRLGKEDNFWEVGLGPCGPDSEIHFDRGSEYGCGKPDCKPGCDCDRFTEVWNLVFTQFCKEEDGSYSKLSNPNIDTGMGLERIACVMQGVNTLFDVDTIRAIRDRICELAGISYGADRKNDISVRIITDHIRSVTFMAADGVLPSNEGRGYVLRRLLRRAARHGKLLGINGTFMSGLSGVVIEVSKEAYPEIADKRDYIFKVVSVEENKFYETIDAGTDILKSYILKLKNEDKKVLPGGEAFKLYDTYGFPVELMKEILEEAGVEIDTDGFNTEMENQRTRARSARGESDYMGADKTVFNSLDVSLTTEYAGYEFFKTNDSKIVALISGGEQTTVAEAGAEVVVILDRTPFYAESGGQKGDGGVIKTQSGSVLVTDCKRVVGNKIAHFGEVASGCIKVGETVCAEVDAVTRMNTARNHTSTHLLQHALRAVLGSHVEQAGSNVDSERLRFDFTHFAPMTTAELKRVEELVNESIFAALPVDISEKAIDEARKMGAMALFGEKYGDTVRVVNIGGESIELCGGTHLTNTAQAGTFKITAENGVASGVRRIEALTGRGALEYYHKIEAERDKVCEILKASPDNLLSRVNQILTRSGELSAELEKYKSEKSLGMIDDIIKNKEILGDISIVTARFNDVDIDGMKDLGDKIRDKVKSAVIVLASEVSADGGKVNLVVMADDAAVKAGINAGGIIKEAAAVVGGKGGGRNNMAQAGGKDVQKIAESLEKAREVIAKQVKG